MPFCSECGETLTAAQNFCASCGVPVRSRDAVARAAPRPSPSMARAMTPRCPRCNGMLRPGRAFCTSCGTPTGLPPAPPLSGAAAPVAATEFADAGRRAGAFAIDFVVVFLLTAMFGRSGAVAVLLLWGAYWVGLEAFWNGQTLGKKMVGIRVSRCDGQDARFGQVLVRALLRIVDIVVVGPVLILTTDRRQRLGDMAAGTVVVSG